MLPRLVVAAILLFAATAASAEKAILAGGCFWCVEADFESVAGVREVVSGYTGGTVDNPTYRQVSSQRTGHYEAVEIDFNPGRVGYERILWLFFRSIDPTDGGGQFCDRGSSYRTAVFVRDAEQRAIAERAKAAAEAELGRRIVTPILPAARFWPAEDYHQDYYRSRDVILTRFGPRRKEAAYKLYREGCGRDRRIRELWGSDAPFLGH